MTMEFNGCGRYFTLCLTNSRYTKLVADIIFGFVVIVIM